MSDDLEKEKEQEKERIRNASYPYLDQRNEELTPELMDGFTHEMVESTSLVPATPLLILVDTEDAGLEDLYPVATNVKPHEIPATPVINIEINERGRPDPKWVRGKCPTCGDDLVSNLYYIGGKGYLIVWTCWGSMQDPPTCTYCRML